MRDVAIIDLETTGLEPQTCGITEIYGIRAQLTDILDRNKDNWRTIHEYILPASECYVSDCTAQITGYDRNKWIYELDAPQYPEVAEEISSFLDDTLLTGWNIEFDRNFIIGECKRWGLEIPKWDYHRFDISTLAMNLYFSGEIESLSMSKAAPYFGLDTSNLHSAKPDVELSIELLRILWRSYTSCPKGIE